MSTFFVLLGALICINLLLLVFSNSLVYGSPKRKKDTSVPRHQGIKIYPLETKDSEFRSAV